LILDGDTRREAGDVGKFEAENEEADLIPTGNGIQGPRSRPVRSATLVFDRCRGDRRNHQPKRDI
jgi:hypothetical protein